MDKEAIRKALLNEKNDLLKQVNPGEGNAGETSMRSSVEELSTADNHPADLGSELFERSKDFSIREKKLFLLRNIDHALNKLDSGKYGVCERCGNKIMEERLEAVPYTKFCFHCQEEEEGKQFAGDRPVEEDLLEPPFARDVDGKSSGHDAEDFWQEAARHNKRPRIFEDGLEDEETGIVEHTDKISNEEYRRQFRE